MTLSGDKTPATVQVPPYVSCAMCGEADSADGEWSDGSERTCLHCGTEGALTAYDHHTGHTFWVLHGIFEDVI